MKRHHTLFLLLLIMPVCLRAKTIYVDDDATGPANGSSWSQAHRFLQDALAEAETSASPVTIRVAQGLYLPDANTSDPNGSGDRGASFSLISGVTLRGGYAGLGSTDPNTRDITAYETTLSGDLAGNDVAWTDDMDLVTEPTRQDNSYHVVKASGTDPNAILDGFTISGGFANGSGEVIGGNGAGVFFMTGSPTLRSCRFTDNIATVGGAISCYHDSYAILEDCEFSHCRASEEGGAIVCYNNSHATLDECEFSHCRALERGGAIYSYASSPRLTRCRFNDNAVTGDQARGGALSSVNQSRPTLSHCTFTRNGAPLSDGYGGAVHNSAQSSLTLLDCQFTENASSVGAGLFNWQSNLALKGCSFTENSAQDMGGALFSYDSVSTVEKCTFAGNVASDKAGALFCYDSVSSLEECTFTENTTDNKAGALFCYNSVSSLEKCTFAENVTDEGGAVYSFKSECQFDDCSFLKNEAMYGGALYDHQSNSSLDACQFIENSALGMGGALHGYASASELEKCTFTDNVAVQGGALFNQSSGSTIIDCRFHRNRTVLYDYDNYESSGGGAIVNYGNSLDNPLTVLRCDFTENNASLGGAINNFSGCANLTDCSFTANSASTGGALCSTTAAARLSAIAGSSPTRRNQEGPSKAWAAYRHSDTAILKTMWRMLVEPLR